MSYIYNGMTTVVFRGADEPLYSAIGTIIDGVSYVEAEARVMEVNHEPDGEFEPYIFITRKVINNASFNYTFTLVLNPLKLPAVGSGTNIEDFYLTGILKKPYLYLKTTNYNLGSDFTKVYVTGYKIDRKQDLAAKQITIELVNEWI